MKKKTMKKAGAIALAGMVGLGLGVGAGFVMDQPDVVEVPYEVVKTVEVPGPVQIVNQTVTETVEVPIEVEKIIEVPVDGTEDVIEFIIDEDGDLTELDLDEIEDHGLDELISQVAFIRESKVMSADWVDRELADELDRREVRGVTLDEDDIERVRVDDDIDEMDIDDIDFDDMDADVTVRATFEQDDVEYEAYFRVEIKDGEIDDVDVISVDEL